MNISTFAHAWQDEDLLIEVNDSQAECVVHVGEVRIFMTLKQAEQLQRTIEHYIIDREHVEAIKMNKNIDMLTASPSA